MAKTKAATPEPAEGSTTAPSADVNTIEATTEPDSTPSTLPEAVEPSAEESRKLAEEQAIKSALNDARRLLRSDNQGGVRFLIVGPVENVTLYTQRGDSYERWTGGTPNDVARRIKELQQTKADADKPAK